MESLAFILLASGASTRMGHARRKPFIELSGRAVLLRALDAFADIAWIGQRIVVLSEADFHEIAGATARSPLQVQSHAHKESPLFVELAHLAVDTLVVGGARRQDSARMGLAAVDPAHAFVAVHDAARPFADAALLERVFDAAREYGAAVPVIAVKDTIKRGQRGGMVEQTLPREMLWAVQTPQVFSRVLLERAHALHLAEATDDAAMVEALGAPVRLVEGDERNMKLTTPMDMRLAELILGNK